MPEAVETKASCALAQHWFSSIKSICLLILLHIYLDATEAEQKRFPKDSLAYQGHAYPIQPGSTAARGPRFAQQRVYPPIGSCTITDAKLQLVDVFFNPRNVILQFSKGSEYLWLQVQMLTHTVVQIFSRDQWDNTISKVDKTSRGFKIGMALDFGEYVMAFLTIDMVFTPNWAPSRETLPAQHPDVYLSFDSFLTEAVQWAESRQSCGRNGLAVNAIRGASTVFGGVGVYTVCELFFRAGLSPFLTEAEVFDVPSRFARICEALYAHIEYAEKHVWDFIRPFLNGTFSLAVANEDRLRYKYWLYVYAKDRVYIPQRMHDLWNAYLEQLNTLTLSDMPWHRDSALGLYDVFEPTYLQASLSKPQNLGHLIFGESDWLRLGGKLWLESPFEGYFKRIGISLSSPTCLDSRPLSFLFVESLRDTWVDTYLYDSSEKSIWSLVPTFPSNSLPMIRTGLRRPRRGGKLPNTTVTLVTGDARKRQLFDYVVKHTKGYAVGPLDYCGIGYKYSGYIAICRNDPMLPSHITKRLEQGIERRSRVKPGQRKGAITTPAVRSKQGKRKRTGNSSVEQGSSSVIVLGTSLVQNQPAIVTDSADAPSPPKRRRLSADQRLLRGIA